MKTKVYLRAYHASTRSAPDKVRVYAHLYDWATKELIISATLDYVLDAVEERNYLLVSEPQSAE